MILLNQEDLTKPERTEHDGQEGTYEALEIPG